MADGDVDGSQPKTHLLTVKETGVKGVEELIDQLAGISRLPSARAQTLYRRYTERALQRMHETGETFGQATGGPPHLNQPHDEFRRTIKQTDNDLEFQLEWLTTNLNDWFMHGLPPAPYPAWRLAIILRRMKYKNTETSFLTAWCKHFPDGNGRRYQQLLERARKVGAI